MSIKNGKVVIHAVHERDAEKFWKKLELEDVEKCFICGEDVTWRSFGAVGVYEGKIVVCCESPRCFIDFEIKLRDRSLPKVGVVG